MATAAATLSFGALAAAPASSATVFTAVGGVQTTNIEFDGYVGDVFTSNLSALLTLSLSSVTDTALGNTFNFSYELSNTSSADSRLSVFGARAVPATFTLGNLTGFEVGVIGSNNPPQAVTNEVNFCLKDLGSQTNNCNNGSDGIADGSSLTGTFSLVFANGDQSQVTFDNFFTRFQSISPAILGQDSGVGIQCGGLNQRPCDGGGVVGNPVPEPATWAMMIMGFGGVGAVIRRRRLVVA